jgi:hypothetical protein
MSETLFDRPDARSAEVEEARARTAAAACIHEVAERYRSDAEKASAAGLAPVAALYWAIVRELDRAAQIALTGTDPGDAGTAVTR